jgi:hypothetical protein
MIASAIQATRAHGRLTSLPVHSTILYIEDGSVEGEERL